MTQKTTREHLIDHARDLIKERGYISAMELVIKLADMFYTIGHKEGNVDNAVKLINNSIANDINYHKVEYTNVNATHRVKDLFYYMPK